MNQRPLRICLHGGPGTGKSSLAAWLVGELKFRGLPVELVDEYVKAWAWQKIPVQGFDQLYLFAKQLRREEILLRNGQSIITDSPLLIILAYSQKYSPELVEPLRQIAWQFERKYRSLNFYLTRPRADYNPAGRYETPEELAEADWRIKAILQAETHAFKTIDSFMDRIMVLGDCFMSLTDPTSVVATKTPMTYKEMVKELGAIAKPTAEKDVPLSVDPDDYPLF